MEGEERRGREKRGETGGEGGDRGGREGEVTYKLVTCQRT